MQEIKKRFKNEFTPSVAKPSTVLFKTYVLSLNYVGLVGSFEVCPVLMISSGLQSLILTHHSLVWCILYTQHGEVEKL